jgi:hypothetical protein
MDFCEEESEAQVGCQAFNPFTQGSGIDLKANIFYTLFSEPSDIHPSGDLE